MTWEDIGTIFAIVVSVASLFASSMRRDREQVAKLAKLEVKVDTMWGFIMRRATAEAVSKDLGTMNSPLIINQAAADKLDVIRDDLRAFFAGLKKPNINDSELGLLIEKNFGEILLTKICIPNDWNQGACLLVAMAVARGVEKVDVSDKSDTPTIISDHKLPVSPVVAPVVTVLKKLKPE